MGFYLNSKKAYTLYKNESVRQYFVDKTAFLEELIPMVREGTRYLCITRPRRFGKTIMANMVSSFFGKGADSHDIFDSLAIGSSPNYDENINRYNVIAITFNELPRADFSYLKYISRIEKIIYEDLVETYPAITLHEDNAIWDMLTQIFLETGEKFIFVFDEWDYIFHQNFVSDVEKQSFIKFLSTLLKDQPYVSLAYMTGILPISKYSSGSELNMFTEYTMVNQNRFSEAFGFTENEVDDLYHRYLAIEQTPYISREGLRLWYNGYHTASGNRVYNPRSVVLALDNNQLASYWTSSGPYDEIFFYVKNNIAEVRDALALMVAGEGVPAKVQEYASVSMELKTRNQIFSAMVVYGFLTFSNGKVFIPNKELMDKFDEMLMQEDSLGYVYRLAKASERMLYATLHQDTKTMAEILAFAHNTEAPLLVYNHETELSAIVNLVYLSARDYYQVEREDKAGIGFVDFIFYPYYKNEDCIILELKVGHSADEAIRQIKDKKYALRFLGKLSEEPPYTGRILAVGIGYDKESKIHECKVEILRG